MGGRGAGGGEVVWIGLLGPLRAADDAGAPLSLTGARLRVLLAALALNAGRPVAGDVLAELVWDGAPPAGYATTLRSHVMRLRRALPAARIETGEAGYALSAEGLSLDVAEFEALCRRASAAGRAEAWPEASRAAALALDLWRGAPLADVPSQALRDRVVPRLEHLWVQACEDRGEAELALGRHEQLVVPLRELVARYPLRERFHAQLMLALFHGGRQAEALEAYEGARRVLVEQLGTEPGALLRRVHERVLAGDGASHVPKAPATYRTSATSGRAEASADPDMDAVARPRQLPAAPGHFTGRSAELEWLTGARGRGDAGDAGTVLICALDGMAGIGKTALAVHAAHRLAEAFPDGQLFVDLHGHTRDHPPREPGQALETLLRALRVPAAQIPADPEECAALYRQRLAGTRTLIVLDNALSEAQVRPLLPGHPGCLVLITSRRRLKGLDDARSLPLDLLPPAQAASLVRAVAGAERIAPEDPMLGEIAALCGNLPLALRIAGALLRHRPAWRLGHLAELLRGQPGVARLSDGERDLGAVFDLSYLALDEQHRKAFRRLGLVPGPDADAFAAAALLECDPGVAAGLLADLDDHNLLTEHAPGRYRMHDLIRAHAHALAEQDPPGEHEAAFHRLLHYYGHTAQGASDLIARHPRPAPDSPAPAHRPVLPDPAAARAWLRAERENLEAAHARASGLDVHAVALAAGLAEILHTDGPLTYALELHRAAAATAQRHGWSAAHATALTDLAAAQRLVGDPPAALDAAARALAIRRAAGNRLGQALALLGVGTALAQAGHLPRADDAFTEALGLYRAAGDRRGQAAALNNLGKARRWAGDLRGAEQALAEALELYQAAGNQPGEAMALVNLADLRRWAGDLPGAEDALTRALELSRAAGDRAGEATALTYLASVWRQAGDASAAVEAAAAALEIHRAIGSRGSETWAFNHYAAAVAATGDTPRALALYRQSATMNRELNKPDDEAIALEGLGECHLSAGESDLAVAYLEQALGIFQRVGMTPNAEHVRARLADLGAR